MVLITVISGVYSSGQLKVKKKKKKKETVSFPPMSLVVRCLAVITQSHLSHYITSCATVVITHQKYFYFGHLAVLVYFFPRVCSTQRSG